MKFHPSPFKYRPYNLRMSNHHAHWDECPEVECQPGKVSGAWVFRDTRVPVTSLFENLRDGATLDEFLEWFPGVTRHQAQAVEKSEWRMQNSE